MEEMIIPSKLIKLKAGEHVLSRTDIETNLNDDKYGLAVVACQTGYGKSTTISQWIENNKAIHYIWYSLDTTDDDFLMFLTYLTEGLRSQDKDVASQLSGLLQQFNSIEHGQLIRMYARVLHKLSNKVVIVLDDFHLISNTSVYDLLTCMIDFLGEKIKLIFISRDELKIGLSKHYLENRVLTIGENDLKFNVKEVSQLLIQAQGPPLSGVDQHDLAEHLTQTTEGWIAGIKLAMIALENEGVDLKATSQIKKNHTLLMRYIFEEVLKHLPETLKTFLMISSIPDRFSVAMCDSVFDLFIKDSKKHMDTLLNKNMFLIEIDPDQEMYRYHHLFREVLTAYHRGQVGVDFDNRTQSIQLAVADWYEKNEKYHEAVQLYLNCSSFEKAARCIEYMWAPMYLTLNSGMWLKFADNLPLEVIKERPVLSMAWAWSLIDMNRIEEAPFWLDHIETRHKQTSLSSLKRKGLVWDVKEYETIGVNLLLAKAYIAAATGNLEDLFKFGNEAVEEMGHKTLEKFGVIMVTMAFAHWSNNDFKKTAVYIDKGILYEKQYGDPINVDNYKMVRLWLWLHQQKHEMVQVETLKLMRKIEGEGTFPILLPTLNLILAYSAYQQDDMDGYRTYIKAARSHANECAIMDFEYRYYLLRALVQLKSKDIESASIFLSEAKFHIYPNPIPDLYSIEEVQKSIDQAQLIESKENDSGLDETIEALTVRELEVLELIEAGFSNKEISQTLFIALSTVKGYIQNIFGKLQVKRRTEAVSKAKRLHII